MNEEMLISALEREAEMAEDSWERLREHQRFALDYYEARPFGNEMPGRSQIILPDVQETCDYMLASVLRPFISGGRVVEFECTCEEDEKGADDATAAMHYLFMRKQDGRRVLHDVAMDGLRERIGIFETTCETKERVTVETVQIFDPVELENIDGEIEDVADNADGSLMVRFKRVTSEKCYVDHAVPSQEFRFSVQAICEDDADYIARLQIVTRSDLVDMGFDREQAYRVKAHDYDLRNDRGLSVGDKYQDDYYGFESSEESTPALEKVLLRKEFARFDIDDDGIAERVKVYRVENEILIMDGKPSIEVVEDQPFVVFSPFPRPHRIVGYGLADKIMDLQLVRSTFARQIMDGMYLDNMPRPMIEITGNTSAQTIADFLAPVPGSPIRYSGTVPQPYPSNFDAGKSLSVLEWATGERESRSGITRLNQGLDADAQNKTATGTAMLQAQGQQHEEFIAGNLAHALGRLFEKKYRLLKREGAKMRIKVDGKYKEIDASQWPDEFSLNVLVGLGTGSKDKKIQARMLVIPMMAEGLAQGLVTPKHSFKMIDGLVRDMGLGQGDDYWVDPDAPPEIDPNTGQPKVEQERPDPEMEKVKAEQQMAQQKMQSEQQIQQARLESERELGAAKLEMAREDAMIRSELAREKASLEAQLARDRAEFEAQMSEQRLAQEMELAERRMAMDERMSEQKALTKQRPGGDLDK